jgi:hypothetical protein
MNKPANRKRVLALDVRPRSFGYVVFEGPDLLLDWGVQSFRNGRNAVRIPLATKISASLEDFRPAVVVAKEPPSRKKVNRARTRKILELIRHKANPALTSFTIELLVRGSTGCALVSFAPWTGPLPWTEILKRSDFWAGTAHPEHKSSNRVASIALYTGISSS